MNRTFHPLYRSLFLLLCINLILLPYVMAQSATPIKIESRRANSNNLTVYQTPTTQSRIIGRLLLNETILVVSGSGKKTQEGTWFKIVSPFEGYYFRDGSVWKYGRFQSFEQSKSASNLKPDSKETSTKRPESSKSVWGRFFDSMFGSKKSKTRASENKIPKREKRRGRSFLDAMESGREGYRLSFGVGLWSLAEEMGYATATIPTDIHLDFIGEFRTLSNVRFGLNLYQSYRGDYTVATKSLYAVYKVSANRLKIPRLSAFLFGGTAWMVSGLSGRYSGSDSGIGLVSGIGGYYNYDPEIKLGGQFVYFSRQSDFGAVKRYVGSTQLLITGSITF